MDNVTQVVNWSYSFILSLKSTKLLCIPCEQGWYLVGLDSSDFTALDGSDLHICREHGYLDNLANETRPRHRSLVFQSLYCDGNFLFELNSKLKTPYLGIHSQIHLYQYPLAPEISGGRRICT